MTWRPSALVREWTRPWPGSGPGEHASAVHLISFDVERFGRSDAQGAPLAGLGWSDGLTRSVTKRQAEFVFGRLAARAAMAAQGLAPTLVGTGPDREPLWPPGVVGTISHVDGLAAAAVAPACSLMGLGLDIERVTRGGRLAALRELAADRNELALLSRQAVHDVDHWVTVLFSAKESLYKAAFPTVRRFFGFEAARVVAVDPSAGQLVLELREPLGHRFTAGSRWSVAFGMLQPDLVITGLRIPACERPVIPS